LLSFVRLINCQLITMYKFDLNTNIFSLNVYLGFSSTLGNHIMTTVNAFNILTSDLCLEVVEEKQKIKVGIVDL